MIDVGMGVEAASEWLPLYLAAEQMTASHPLREKAFADADAAVIESFAACVWTEDIGALPSGPEVARELAGDVIEVLRGCAVLIATGEIERTNQENGSGPGHAPRTP